MLKKLLTPIKIAGHEVRNRIVMTAMHLNYTPDGMVNDRLVAFYEERARGGAGLIIVGGCNINDVSGAMHLVSMRDDSCIEGHSVLAEAIKKHGATAACQLYHSGRYSHSFAMEGRQAVAPSAVPSRFTGEMPKEMTCEEIQQTVRDYSEAARRAKEADYDLVEVLASTGYLIPQFLSPTVNLRSDEYGGPLENRMRFGLEVADAVREIIGPGFPLSFRIDGHDFMEGGNTNREWALFAAELEKHGVNVINVTGGWHETNVPQLPMSVPRAGLAYLATGVKKMVGVPVIASNRINDVFLADELIRKGMTDMTAMSRALIADPYLAQKAYEGRYGEIIHCIGCNQGCFDNVFYLRPVTCTLNPRAGKETEYKMEIAKDRVSAPLVLLCTSHATSTLARLFSVRQRPSAKRLSPAGGEAAFRKALMRDSAQIRGYVPIPTRRRSLLKTQMVQPLFRSISRKLLMACFNADLVMTCLFQSKVCFLTLYFYLQL